jgi:hypothetical protein
MQTCHDVTDESIIGKSCSQFNLTVNCFLKKGGVGQLLSFDCLIINLLVISKKWVFTNEQQRLSNIN